MADDTVLRWVVTHVNRDGDRVLTFAQQGRETYATEDEARRLCEAVGANNSDDRLASVYGAQAIGTFEPRLVPCWPGHFDPKGIFA